MFGVWFWFLYFQGFLLCSLGLICFPCLLFCCWNSVFPLLSPVLLPFVHLPDCLHLCLVCSLVYLSLIFSRLPCWFVCFRSVFEPFGLSSCSWSCHVLLCSLLCSVSFSLLDCPALAVFCCSERKASVGLLRSPAFGSWPLTLTKTLTHTGRSYRTEIYMKHTEVRSWKCFAGNVFCPGYDFQTCVRPAGCHHSPACQWWRRWRITWQ